MFNLKNLGQTTFRLILPAALCWSICLSPLAYSDSSKKTNNKTSASKATSKPNTSLECTPPRKGTILKNRSASKGNSSALNPNNRQCVSPKAQFAGKGIVFGNFCLENDAWNAHRSTWDWKQCIEVLKNDDDALIATWQYDWGDEDSLVEGFQEWEVKSFPGVVFGYNEGSPKNSCSDSGLPLSVKKLPKFKIDYKYSDTQSNRRKGDLDEWKGASTPTTGGDRNAIIRATFHPSCPVSGKPAPPEAFRLLVWLETGPERTPTGNPSTIDPFTDSLGQKFSVYTKITWANDAYIAFTAIDEKKAGSIVLNDFIQYVRRNHKKLELTPFKQDWCLGSIKFGTEIWWGEGSFTVEQFDITRLY